MEPVATVAKQAATDCAGLANRQVGTGRPVGLPTQSAPLIGGAGNKKAPAINLWRLCANLLPVATPVPPLLGGRETMARMTERSQGVGLV